MNALKNGSGVYRWVAGILALAVLSAGGVILNHETRITRVEAQVEMYFGSINDSLQRLESRLAE